MVKVSEVTKEDTAEVACAEVAEEFEVTEVEFTVGGDVCGGFDG